MAARLRPRYRAPPGDGQHDYYAFGLELSGGANDGERLKFTGHERDVAALDYMHARYYDASMGRFLSVDPSTDLESAVASPQRWNRYAYVRNNPVGATDPDGRDEISFGGQDVTVFTGEVLVLSSPKGGLHVATYMTSGPSGEVFAYDNTSARNQDLSGLTARTARNFPDNRGNNHPAHDLKAPSVNGSPNDFSPQQGTRVLGVVHTNRKVGVGELAEVAPGVKMFHNSKAEGKQCTDFVKALADAARYKLVGIGAARKTTEFTAPGVLDKTVVREKQ